MRRTDDAGNRIVKQDRRTIGRQHAERNAWNRRHETVRDGRFFAMPRPLHIDDLGAMDLADRHQPIGGKAETCHCDCAVGRDPLRSIAGAEATIQRAEQTLTDTALAGEECVTDAGIGAERCRGDHLFGLVHHRVVLKPGGVGSPEETSVIALNRVPIPLGSSKRPTPLSSACCWLGVALARSAAARSRAPSLASSCACGTGPWISTQPARAASANAAKST